jgi:hypothetical protein
VWGVVWSLFPYGGKRLEMCDLDCVSMFSCAFSGVDQCTGFTNGDGPEELHQTNPSTCSHSDDSGGVSDFVPPRTPRSSGYDFLCTCGLCC